jgi:hypothetical protein
MSGCTLQLTRDSALRTVLVDQAAGHAKYQIDTPVKLARSVTRIRKLDSPTHPHDHWGGDADSDYGADSDSGDESTDKGEHKKKPQKKGEEDNEEGDGTIPELPETGDEIARIDWSWFSSNKIVFQGRTTTRREFLPKTGKVGG